MKLKKDSTDQKLRGVYYTPIELANGIVSYFRNADLSTILEPSCGDGVFIDSIESNVLFNNGIKLSAIEIDGDVAKLLKEKKKGDHRIEVFNDDFFNYYERVYKTSTYDLIIGNPPYIRYQYLTESQRHKLSEILESHGMKSNKLINAWVGFLVACIQLLSDKGKIAFVIPAEILQVVYAEDLRYFITENLSTITLITFRKLVFTDIEQEVIVFIGEKGNNQHSLIRTIELDDLSSFDSINYDDHPYKELVHSSDKWTRYFTSAEESELIQVVKTDPRFRNFSDIALINVGITTGNNSFFSVDSMVAERYNLSVISRPLIGKSSHANGIFFTAADWNENVLKGKKAQLVVFPDVPLTNYDRQHLEYINLGVSNDEHSGYKCSVRDKWYIVPSIWTPDAFFLRRNNLYPKLVLNRCEAVSTDTMHRIKFKEDIDHELAILSYYNSISFAFTEICGRSYGGGVLEILPSEVDKIRLPIIQNIAPEIKYRLLDSIDTIIRMNKNIELALDLVDNEILIQMLGIDPETCRTFRHIWKKLRQRRLTRGD